MPRLPAFQSWRRRRPSWPAGRGPQGLVRGGRRAGRPRREDGLAPRRGWPPRRRRGRRGRRRRRTADPGPRRRRGWSGRRRRRSPRCGAGRRPARSAAPRPAWPAGRGRRASHCRPSPVGSASGSPTAHQLSRSPGPPERIPLAGAGNRRRLMAARRRKPGSSGRVTPKGTAPARPPARRRRTTRRRRSRSAGGRPTRLPALVGVHVGGGRASSSWSAASFGWRLHPGHRVHRHRPVLPAGRRRHRCAPRATPGRALVAAGQADRGSDRAGRLRPTRPTAAMTWRPTRRPWWAGGPRRPSWRGACWG